MTGPSAQQWRTTFADMEWCPWPGPRPLRYDDDEHLLCGRDEDISRFLNEVDSYRVIFLTGSSGVGKTSLLRRGIVPELEEAGYLVAVCRDWSGAAEESSPATFLANRVADALRSRIPDLPSDTSIMRELSERYGERAVLILDQFEELIRDARGFTQQLFDALASLNRHTNIKIVISLRSEHLHELRPLEHRVQPFSTTYFYLERVKDGYVKEIVSAGNHSAHKKLERDAIDSDAINAIQGAWTSASKSEKALNAEPPGLLGLQALLYVLHDRAAGEMVTGGTVTSFFEEMHLDQNDPAQANRLFNLGLSEAAEAKLGRCRDASISIGLDECLVEGAMSILSRSVQHLTSGGYKLVRNVWDLVNLALDDELAALLRGMEVSHDAAPSQPDGRPTDLQIRAMSDVIVRSILINRESDIPGEASPADATLRLDFLSASRLELASAADEAADPGGASWVDRLHVGASSFAADPAEVTAGPMMGRAPAAVLIEELRRFALALQWLRASYLVRISTPTAGLMTIALIHDGFGTALERWSAEQSLGPGGAIRALTANGGAFCWPSEEGEFWDAFDGRSADDGVRLLVNLRWRGGSIVETSFRQLSFINCDLRGALFAQCRFEGVSFVNCLLDGLMLSDCLIVGEASPRPATYSSGAVSFTIADSATEAALLASYTGFTGPTELVLAELPGLPACPTTNNDSLTLFDVERGSLIVRGGRTAALSLRKLSFGAGASFCLRDSAGSGFDVIEHSSMATFEITGCVLRHASFTTPPNRSLAEKESEPIAINAYGSVIYQAWIGDDLNGNFTADDCTLLHIWNGSPTDNFSATATGGSTFHGLVGVHPDDSCIPLIPGEQIASVRELDGDAPGRIIPASLLMDYRRSSEDDEAVLARQQSQTQ